MSKAKRNNSRAHPSYSPQKIQKSLIVAKPCAPLIPLSIFSRDIGVLETIVKYLREQGLTLKSISKALGRNSQVLWSSHAAAIRKSARPFSGFSSYIPLSEFLRPGLTCFESIVLGLHEEYEFSFHKIAGIFGRDYQTVWTTYRRAQQKNGQR